MKETNEEAKSTSTKSIIKRYEEITNDGKVYHPIRELQELNLSLQCSRKDGVIITGPPGSGKTALVHCFAQQNLQELFEIETLKVVRLRPIWTIKRVDMDEFLQAIRACIKDFKSSALLIYAEFDNLDLLKNAVETVNFYLSDIKEDYNMKFLKFIFEFTKNTKMDMEQINKAMKNSWDMINCIQEKDIDLFIDRLMPRVDELSKKYGIEYNRDTVMFYAVVQAGWSNIDNLNPFIDVIEKAFILTKKAGKTSLDRDSAEILFPKTFEQLKKTPIKALRNTARHEAGHTLMCLLNNNGWKVSFVSIVPGNGFNGVTAYDKPEKVYNYYKNKKYYLMEIAADLAGRVAERVLDKNVKPNSGAIADLKCAMTLINDIISKYGISKVLGKNYVILERDVISEKNVEAVEQLKKELLEKAEEIAKRLIKEHRDFVEELAERLCKDLVVYNYQIYDMWNEYLKHKK